MSGSKDRAMPATLTKSGEGRSAAGSNMDRTALIDNMATMTATIMLVQDFVIDWKRVRTYLMAVSIGSVLCWTSARIANLMSINGN